MGSALVVAVVKYGLLALLWAFVLLVVRAVREDLGYRAAPSAPAPAAARAEAAVKPRRRKGVPRQLVVTEGPLTGTTLALETTPITLGRGHGCTLVLADDYASTHHARLAPAERGWVLEDLGSTNGTYLGREKVTRPTPVPVGTPIRIGKTALELRA
jgi:pSer/pThr/pTyr-binding forkhead associated (FHA) protein